MPLEDIASFTGPGIARAFAGASSKLIYRHDTRQGFESTSQNEAQCHPKGVQDTLESCCEKDRPWITRLDSALGRV